MKFFSKKKRLYFEKLPAGYPQSYCRMYRTVVYAGRYGTKRRIAVCGSRRISRLFAEQDPGLLLKAVMDHEQTGADARYVMAGSGMTLVFEGGMVMVTVLRGRSRHPGRPGTAYTEFWKFRQYVYKNAETAGVLKK